MVKSVQLDDNTHKKLEKVHSLLKQKYRVKVSYGDIIDKVLDNPEEIAKNFFLVPGSKNE